MVSIINIIEQQEYLILTLYKYVFSHIINLWNSFTMLSQYESAWSVSLVLKGN